MKNWNTPTISILNQDTVKSGGSATGGPYPEYIKVCVSSATVTYDQFASFPSFGSVIIPGATGSTAVVYNNTCS